MKLNTIKSTNHSIEKQTHLDLILYFIFHCMCVFVYFHISINNKIKNAVNHDIRGHKNTNKK